MRDRPELTTKGRYYFAKPGTPHAPFFHFYGSRIWHDRNIPTIVQLGELVTYKQEWNNGAPPRAIPPANSIGDLDCFLSGERFPLPVVTREFIDGIDSRCFAALDIRDVAWMRLSSINDCACQRFHAHVIDLLYAHTDGAVVAFIEALIGPAFQIRVHRGVSPFLNVVTITSSQWSVAIMDGTRDFQQFALQAFDALAGPQNVGQFSTVALWRDMAVYVEGLLRADGLFAGNKVALAGHSYGGAVACVMACRLRLWKTEQQVQLLTFGCPKAGDRRFESIMQSVSQFHIANDNDVVTVLPPSNVDVAQVASLIAGPVASRLAAWRPTPGRVKMDAFGNFHEYVERIDDYEVLVTLLAEAITHFPHAPIEGHFIGTYAARLALRCPNVEWPVNPAVVELEAIAIPNLPIAADRPGAGFSDGRQGSAKARGAIALATIAPPIPCAGCIGALPSRWQFNPLTVMNGTCLDCALANTIITLNYFAGCTWKSTLTPFQCWTDGNSIWYLSQSFGIWNLILGSTSFGSHPVSYSASASTWSCTTPNVMTKDFANPLCIWPPAIVITPVP